MMSPGVVYLVGTVAQADELDWIEPAHDEEVEYAASHARA